MSVGYKLTPGIMFPSFSLPAVGGDTIDVGAMPGWRMLIVYRGRHCPLCKKMFKGFDALYDEYRAAGIAVWAISADSRERAEADVASEGWRFPVGYGLSMDQMRELGLYMTGPRPGQDFDHIFAEPACFIINPQGVLQIIDLSNAPFMRPDFAMLLAGLQYEQTSHFPIRGTIA